MFYATTLIASGAAVWGDDSILFSIFVLIFWAARFFIGESRFKNAFLPTSLIILCVLAILYYLIVPSVFINREALRRIHRKNNMRQLVLGMLNYESAFGQLPNAIETINGNSHSWRTRILPFIEEQNRFNLYDYSLPWDSTVNMKLVSPVATPSSFSPDQEGKTIFKLVVGEGTVFQSGRTPTIDSIKDGAENTIVLIEDHADPVFFSQPKDIDIEEAVVKLSRPNIADATHAKKETFATTYYYDSINVVCADGSAHSIGFGIDPELLCRAFLCADGKPIDIEQLVQPPLRVINYQAVIAATIYVGLILLPIWTYRKLRAQPSGNQRDVLTRQASARPR